VTNRAFYAINDTLTPLLVGGSTIIINILLSIVFYKMTNLGVAGMALAYSLASAVNAFLLLSILNRKMKGIYIDRLLRFLFKVVPSAMIMGMVLFITNACFVPDTSAKVVQLFKPHFSDSPGCVGVFLLPCWCLKWRRHCILKIWLYQGLKKIVKK